MVRSTNKGISAIIDNKGNVVKQLDRNEAGNIEFKIPLIKSNKNKNDLIFFSLLITYLFIFLFTKKMTKNNYLFTSESFLRVIQIKYAIEYRYGRRFLFVKRSSLKSGM